MANCAARMSVVLALWAAACAHASAIADGRSDLRVAVLSDAGAERARAGQCVSALAVEVTLVGDEGARTVLPRAVCRPGRRAVVARPARSAYPADLLCEFGPVVPAPIEGVAIDGLEVEVRPRVDATGRLSLGWRVGVHRAPRPFPEFQTTLAQGPPVTIAAPTCESDVCGGTCAVDAGAETQVARLPDGGPEGTVRAVVRVTPILLARSPRDTIEADPAESAAATAEDGPFVRLRVAATRIAGDAAPGTVLDEAATRAALARTEGASLREFETTCRLDGTALVACAVDDACVLTVRGGPAGSVAVTWATRAGSRTVTVTPSPAPRFVALAPVAGGGTLGAVVSAVPCPVPPTAFGSGEVVGGVERHFAERWMEHLEGATDR